MSLRLAALLAGGLALVNLPAFAEPPSSPDAAQRLLRLTTAYAPVRTLTATFTQETRFAGFPTPRAFGGRLDLERPRHMRWDYTEGSAQQVYVDGQNVTVYAPESDQAIESTLSPASDAQVPLHLLADVTGIDRTYHVAAGDDPDTLVLTPQERVPGAPERVTLWLAPDTGLIARVRLELPGGSTSDIRFSEVTVNGPVDLARFVFDPPKGTHLIRAADLLPHPTGKAP